MRQLKARNNLRVEYVRDPDGELRMIDPREIAERGRRQLRRQPSDTVIRRRRLLLLQSE